MIECWGDNIVFYRYIDVIKDIDYGVITLVRVMGGETKDFSIIVGLHQGSVLSPDILALVMDELARHVQEKVP